MKVNGSGPLRILKEINIDLEIIDTNGEINNTDFAQLRRKTYKGADALIICVSATDPASLNDASSWRTEFNEALNGEGKPIILVLTKFIASEDSQALVKLEDILKFKRDERFNHQLVKTNTNPDEEVKDDNSVELAFGQAIMLAYDLKYRDIQSAQDISSSHVLG